MSMLSDIVSKPPELAPRPMRRGIGVAVVVVVVAMFAWALAKHAASGGLADSEIEAGLDDLAAAIDGDARGFALAEDHFVDAASVTVVDPYPAFLIRTSRRLAGPRSAGDPHDQIATTILAGDLLAARRHVDGLRGGSDVAARLWDRLLDGLAVRLD